MAKAHQRTTRPGVRVAVVVRYFFQRILLYFGVDVLLHTAMRLPWVPPSPQVPWRTLGPDTVSQITPGWAEGQDGSDLLEHIITWCPYKAHLQKLASSAEDQKTRAWLHNIDLTICYATGHNVMHSFQTAKQYVFCIFISLFPSLLSKPARIVAFNISTCSQKSVNKCGEEFSLFSHSFILCQEIKHTRDVVPLWLTGKGQRKYLKTEKRENSWKEVTPP